MRTEITIARRSERLKELVAVGRAGHAIKIGESMPAVATVAMAQSITAGMRAVPVHERRVSGHRSLELVDRLRDATIRARRRPA